MEGSIYIYPHKIVFTDSEHNHRLTIISDTLDCLVGCQPGEKVILIERPADENS